MRIKAYAKINLGLDILGRRPDGYHDVRMIMETITLHDVIEIQREQEPGIRFFCDSADLAEKEKNLAYRAALLLLDQMPDKGASAGVSIRLHKSIPMAAGLAGGSADAAAVLTGMNEVLGLGYNQEELRALGVRLGADVPYCILKKTALAEGIGEKLTVLPAFPEYDVLIGKPEVSVSTKEAYEAFDHETSPARPDIDNMMQGLLNGDADTVLDGMGNVFEAGITRQHPVVGEIRKLMEQNGAVKAMMTGSGPTVFGLFTDKTALEHAEQALRKSGLAKDIAVCRCGAAPAKVSSIRSTVELPGAS